MNRPPTPTPGGSSINDSQASTEYSSSVFSSPEESVEKLHMKLNLNINMSSESESIFTSDNSGEDQDYVPAPSMDTEEDPPVSQGEESQEDLFTDDEEEESPPPGEGVCGGETGINNNMNGHGGGGHSASGSNSSSTKESSVPSPSSGEDDPHADTMNCLKGLLYRDRKNSFLKGGGGQGQGSVVSGFKHSPHELAMAGLEYFGDKSARCVVCYEIFSDMNTQAAEPWVMHSEKSPSCPFIKLGKPERPDSLTLRQWFELAGEKLAIRFQKEEEKLVNETFRGIMQELVLKERESLGKSN